MRWVSRKLGLQISQGHRAGNRRGQGEGERTGEDQDEEFVSKYLLSGLKRREKDSRMWEGQKLRERTPW